MTITRTLCCALALSGLTLTAQAAKVGVS